MIRHYDMATGQPLTAPEATPTNPAMPLPAPLPGPALRLHAQQHTLAAPALPVDLLTMDAARFVRRQQGR